MELVLNCCWHIVFVSIELFLLGELGSIILTAHSSEKLVPTLFF